MFLIEEGKELDLMLLGQIIQRFQTQDLPKLSNYWNYYQGKQNIQKKQPTDVGKPANKLMTNYCYDIVNTYNGYITGIDIAYNSNDNFDEIQRVLNYNDCHSEDSEFLKNALIYGVAYEINYINPIGEHCFKLLDSRSVIPVYYNTLDQELAYVIRFYQSDLINKDEYTVEVYDSKSIKTYRSTMGFSSFELLNEVPHYFGMVPITVFNLNAERESIFYQIMSLQDAYNTLTSDEVDDFESFADAYLVFKGVSADDEDLDDAKRRRAFMIDSDCDISYLTKNINETQIASMLKNINDNIHKISKAPDFNDEKLMAQSGIAMRYKLVGFENMSSAIEANMRKALQKRIELICSILSLKGDDVWRDVKIQFTRNLPTNVVETAQVVNSLRGVVSDKTLLSLLPFITDVDAEIEQLNEEKEANMSMYSFATGNEEDEEDKDKEEVNE